MVVAAVDSANVATGLGRGINTRIEGAYIAVFVLFSFDSMLLYRFRVVKQTVLEPAAEPHVAVLIGRNMEEHKPFDLRTCRRGQRIRLLCVPRNLLWVNVIIGRQICCILSTDGLRVIAARIEKPKAEASSRGVVKRKMRIRSTIAPGRGRRISVVAVGTHELRHVLVAHASAALLCGIFVVVAKGNGPRDTTAFHWQHHVIDGLVDLLWGGWAGGNDIAVDKHKPWLFCVENVLHELDCALIG